MSTYKERVEKTLEDEMSHYDLTTGIISRTLPALRKIHGDDCVFDSYASFLRAHHDYPEKEGYDLFEVGVRFDPDPSYVNPGYKPYEWIPFLPVYVEHGSTEVEIRKAFQASVESYKSFDLKVGSEVSLSEEDTFTVKTVTPLAVYGGDWSILQCDLVDPGDVNYPAPAEPFYEWVSWARINMSVYNERVNKTLVDEMSCHELATGFVSHTLPALRELYGDGCVFDSYTSCLRTYHDYPEKEGYDLFEVGVRFDPDPSLPDYAKLYEWIPFLPVYVEHGSTEVEIRKAFQASVESHKSFDLKVGSEVIVDEGGEGIFRVDVVTPLAVCGDFDGIPEEWVSWASITGVLS